MVSHVPRSSLSSNPLFRKDALADIVFLIRSRIIFTLPRSAAPPGAAPAIKVSLPATPYFISVTGSSDPLPTP